MITSPTTTLTWAINNNKLCKAEMEAFNNIEEGRCVINRQPSTHPYTIYLPQFMVTESHVADESNLFNADNNIVGVASF